MFVRSFGKFGDGPAEFKFPWGVAMDRNSGNIVVSDTHNHRIQVFSQHGIFLKAFDSDLESPDPILSLK